MADEIWGEYFKGIHWRRIWKMTLTCIIQYWTNLLVIMHFIFNFKRRHLKCWHSLVTRGGGLAVLGRTNDWQQQRERGAVEEWDGQMEAVAAGLAAISRWRRPLAWTASFCGLQASGGQRSLRPAALLSAPCSVFQTHFLNMNLIESVSKQKIILCLQVNWARRYFSTRL